MFGRQYEKNIGTGWRHNLKRSSNRGNSVARCNDMTLWDDFESVYKQSTRLKRINKAVNLKLFNQSFCKTRNLMLNCVRDSNKELGAARICIKSGPTLHDVLAGTTAKGRKLSASYSSLWDMLFWGRERGCKIFDFGGVNPFSNPGVYAFKRGIRGEFAELLGSWIYTSSSIREKLFKIGFSLR